MGHNSSREQALPYVCEQAVLPAEANLKWGIEALTPILMKKLFPGRAEIAQYLYCPLSLSALSAKPREKVRLQNKNSDYANLVFPFRTVHSTDVPFQHS